MYLTNEPIPGCVPELHRAQEEKCDRQYDLKMQRQTHYLVNKQKLDVAAGVGLPILDFGGYNACGECPQADHDTRTDDEDDFDRVICGNPACPWHRKNQ